MIKYNNSKLHLHALFKIYFRKNSVLRNFDCVHIRIPKKIVTIFLSTVLVIMDKTEYKRSVWLEVHRTHDKGS